MKDHFTCCWLFSFEKKLKNFQRHLWICPYEVTCVHTTKTLHNICIITLLSGRNWEKNELNGRLGITVFFELLHIFKEFCTMYLALEFANDFIKDIFTWKCNYNLCTYFYCFFLFTETCSLKVNLNDQFVFCSKVILLFLCCTCS